MGGLALFRGVLQEWGMIRRNFTRVAVTSAACLSFPLFSACRTLRADPEKQKASASGKFADSKKAEQERNPWNEAVLRAIEKLPLGGGYSVGRDAKKALQTAVSWEDEKPAIRPREAQPSFCSGATYMALLVALATEQKAGHLSLTPTVWRKLIVEGQGDGEGVWGRWNANGPGTARLFYESGVGRNFTEWGQAQAGDFLKIFWNESIGAEEKGHSVVYLARGIVDGEDTVAFWSSNESEGYGVKQVAFSKIKRAVFSRLEHPERLSRVLDLPEKDEFLASLLEKSVAPKAAAKACGLREL